MQDPIINAAIQVVPVKSLDPYPIVDQAIAVIAASGLSYEVGPFSTSVEGKLEEVLALIPAIKLALSEKGASEILVNMQLQLNFYSDVYAKDKTSKFKSQA